MSTEAIVWLSGFAVWGLYDLWAWATGKRTLSQYVWIESRYHRWIPFAAGLLGGHLFL